MNKHRHLLLIVGFLMMTAAAVVGQVQTTKPGEPVERHLSSDQKFREWSHQPEKADSTAASTASAASADEVKSIKVCRVETVCKMRFKEGETPRTRVRNLVAPLRYESE